jgi:hypothetical protein
MSMFSFSKLFKPMREGLTSSEVQTQITNLNALEQSLYTQLQTNISTLTVDQKNAILTQISNINTLRSSLLSQLQTGYSNYLTTSQASSDLLNQQFLASSVVDAELAKQATYLDDLEKDKEAKLRLAQVNTYYGKQYSAHASVMKLIIYMAIPILIASILVKARILPPIIYTVVISIVLVYGLYFLIYKLLDISNRDNMNFDRYNWYFDKANAPDINNVHDVTTSGDKKCSS